MTILGTLFTTVIGWGGPPKLCSKLLVTTQVTPIILPYITPCITPALRSLDINPFKRRRACWRPPALRLAALPSNPLGARVGSPKFEGFPRILKGFYRRLYVGIYGYKGFRVSQNYRYCFVASPQ